MKRHTVCRTNDLAPGECLKVELDDRDLAVYNVEGQFYATDDFCRHRGGHLGEGILRGQTVLCPEHGWRYDVKTGQCLSHPQGDVKAYPLFHNGDEIQVELPEEND